jgi:hypothetical protein
MSREAERVEGLSTQREGGGVRFVTAYEVTRHYGGPEEGGWWYNWYEPIESIPTIRPEVVKSHLMEKHEGRVHGDIYSVLGGTAVSVIIEDEPAENRSTERPVYC